MRASRGEQVSQFPGAGLPWSDIGPARVSSSGDLFRHDPGRAEAARNAAVALAAFLAKQELTVKTIAGVHGEPASMEDLNAAIARRSANQKR